jgi:hypothetical protein
LLSSPQSQISSLWRLTELAGDLDWLAMFGGSPSQLSSIDIMMKYRGVVASQGQAGVGGCGPRCSSSHNTPEQEDWTGQTEPAAATNITIHAKQISPWTIQTNSAN